MDVDYLERNNGRNAAFSFKVEEVAKKLDDVDEPSKDMQQTNSPMFIKNCDTAFSFKVEEVVNKLEDLEEPGKDMQQTNSSMFIKNCENRENIDRQTEAW